MIWLITVYVHFIIYRLIVFVAIFTEKIFYIPNDVPGEVISKSHNECQFVTCDNKRNLTFNIWQISKTALRNSKIKFWAVQKECLSEQSFGTSGASDRQIVERNYIQRLFCLFTLFYNINIIRLLVNCRDFKLLTISFTVNNIGKAVDRPLGTSWVEKRQRYIK